jgi:hypothetical protein
VTADATVPPRRLALQRQALAGSAALAIALALAVTGGTTDLTFGLYSLGVTVLALSAALVHADSSFPVVVVTLVVIRWLVSDGSPTSPATIAIAACLVAFHTIVALLAGLPPGATVPREVLVRWGHRWLVVIGATALWWAVLVLLSRRDAEASSLATVGALTALVVGLLAVRRRVVTMAADDSA